MRKSTAGARRREKNRKEKDVNMQKKTNFIKKKNQEERGDLIPKGNRH